MSIDLSIKYDKQYPKFLNYLNDISMLGIMPGLERIQAVLRELKNPERSFPSIVVAGTNGKGSSTVMLSSILKEEGYKTGSYTSPHLYSFEERISIDGNLIDKKSVCILSDRIRNVMAYTKSQLTFFEFITVMCFMFFEEQKIDIAVLEVGMGGRLDAVNAVEPLISLITQIGIDHTDWLGGDIKKITEEKAGVIKKNSIVISSCTNIYSKILLEEKTRALGGTIKLYNKNFFISNWQNNGICQHFNFVSSNNKIDDIRLPLLGRHFAVNASGVIESVLMLRHMGFPVKLESIVKGIAAAKSPLRIEVVASNPTIIIDVAHNNSSLYALLSVINENFHGKRIIFVFGIMKDKKHRSMLKTILKYADMIIFTMPNIKRAVDPSIYEDEKRRSNGKIIISPFVADALDTALSNACKEDVICIAGSFYLAVEAKKQFEKYNINQCRSSL